MGNYHKGKRFSIVRLLSVFGDAIYEVFLDRRLRVFIMNLQDGLLGSNCVIRAVHRFFKPSHVMFFENIFKIEFENTLLASETGAYR